MKYFRGGFVCAVLSLIILFQSCSSSKNAQVALNESELTEKQKFEFTYSFFEATKYQLKGNFDLAISIYNECLKIDNTSSAVYHNLSKIYLHKKDFSVAEDYATKAILYNSNNTSYLFLAGFIYQKNNKIDLAEKSFLKLIDIDNTNIEYYLSLAEVYLQAKNYKDAIKVYDNIDKIFGVSEMIALQKNKIYISLNKKEEALNELVKLADANGNAVVYKRMIADFNLQFSEIDKAAVIYNEILIDNPNDGYSHIGLAECYQQKGDNVKAFEEIKHAFACTDVPSDVKISLFINIWQSSEKDTSLGPVLFDLTEVLVEKYPDNPDVNTIYADFLLRSNELEKAKEVLRKILIVRKDKYMLWEQLILIENQFLDWENMYVESKEALKYFPNQSFLYFFKGFSSVQLDKNDEALKAFEFGFKLITEDDPLRKDYLSFLGEVNHRLGNIKEAYKYFDLLLGIDADNLMVLNNYAYYLSEGSSDLNRAKEMSFKTVESEPNNSTYLDTYAWILFKLNDYSEALIYIKRAIDNNMDSSAIIVEHYGDILFHNNKIEEAITTWNLAKTYGEGSDNLNAKIEKQTYIE